MKLFFIVVLSIITIFIGGVVAVFSKSQSRKEANLLDDRRVYIRFGNRTEHDISRIYLGSLSQKANSYTTHSFQTRFSGILSGETSSYRKVSNIRQGYNQMQIDAGRFDDSPRVRRALLSENGAKSYQIPAKFCSPIRWQHPFRPEIITDATGLVAGKYTFILTDWDTRNPKSSWDDAVSVKLLKDS